MSRKIWLPVAVVALAALAIGWGFAGDRNNRRPATTKFVQDSVVKRGFDIAPVPLNMEARNPELVALGSYIVNAQSGCADCHSCPTYAVGHNPYQGGDGQINADNYLAGGVPFGPFVSANLTPDAETGLPAGLTFAQFVDAMRTGHEPHGGTLFVMPWPIYRNMLDRDLAAIYEYLSSIPHADPGTCAGAGE
ncbi:MAG: cytochrome C [Acidobacteria bacterium]|nr:cytochrome C [Acidobacteriota bacterium]